MAQRGDGGKAAVHLAPLLQRAQGRYHGHALLDVGGDLVLCEPILLRLGRHPVDGRDEGGIGLAREFVLEPADGPGGGIALHRQGKTARIHRRIGNHDLCHAVAGSQRLKLGGIAGQRLIARDRGDIGRIAQRQDQADDPVGRPVLVPGRKPGIAIFEEQILAAAGQYRQDEDRRTGAHIGADAAPAQIAVHRIGAEAEVDLADIAHARDLLGLDLIVGHHIGDLVVGEGRQLGDFRRGGELAQQGRQRLALAFEQRLLAGGDRIARGDVDADARNGHRRLVVGSAG